MKRTFRKNKDGDLSGHNIGIQQETASDGKVEYADHKELAHDHDILKGTNVTREDAMHMGELTPEEAQTARRLRRRLDLRIMPLVMSVRSWCRLCLCSEHTLMLYRSI